eukprot:gb/GFBE01023425.1/.p1 GENE.gb/GFBE01023425.1/~~gb/GFBE01023425.1/.p1  ORF type:complete len:121 (+),score=23.46 gb/GFBE01023425.1/:1-363(+)
MAYFYQLGEDIKLVTPSWAGLFTEQLKKQGQLGIVGGREVNFQKTTGFLACVMVSKTHMRIFGTFYPTIMHNWWSDDWMMKSYKPFSPLNATAAGGNREHQEHGPIHGVEGGPATSAEVG